MVHIDAMRLVVFLLLLPHLLLKPQTLRKWRVQLAYAGKNSDARMKLLPRRQQDTLPDLRPACYREQYLTGRGMRGCRHVHAERSSRGNGMS